MNTELVDLGGAGSGNFGHAGRPGEVGGSATAGFTPATPEQRKALGLPPAWTDVLVNPDPNGALQAVGKDKKGRAQYRYSAAHSEEATAEKFERMKAFEKALPELRQQIKKDLLSDDAETRESAAVLFLIDKTGLRVGSERDTLADKRAFGATTLQARHVKVDGDRVKLKFIGKKGVEIRKSVKDSELADMLRIRLEGKSRSNRVFDVHDYNLREYMEKHAPDFTPKDFRTRHATAIALGMVKKLKSPANQKEFKKARREVGKHVAEYLGNTHTVALKSYISPTVFAEWQAAP